jgi:hypothetical protein
MIFVLVVVMGVYAFTLSAEDKRPSIIKVVGIDNGVDNTVKRR